MPASEDDARKMLPSGARDAAAMAMPASGSRCDSWCPDDCCVDRTCGEQMRLRAHATPHVAPISFASNRAGQTRICEAYYASKPQTTGHVECAGAI